MSEERGLLESVLAAPQDDGPRLILADWYEDNGRPERAEFIRVQCELARMEAEGRGEFEFYGLDSTPLADISAVDPDAARRSWLCQRQDALRRRASETELAGLPSLRGVVWCWPERGFVAAVRCPDYRTFERNAGAIFAAGPVQHLLLDSLGADAKTMAASPHFRRLSGLHLSASPGPYDGFAELAASPALANLRTLFLNGSSLPPAAVAPLADNPALARLEKLNLCGLGLGTEVLGPLVRSAHLTALTHLWLRANEVDDWVLMSLASNPALGNLCELDLMRNQLSACLDLAQSPHLGRLRSLDLSDNQLTDAGELLVSPTLRSLQVLALEGNPLGGTLHAGLPGESTHPPLRSLDLSGCLLGPADAAVLAGLPALGALTRLKLSSNLLGDDGVAALARSPYLRNLVALELDGNKIRAAGAKALADWPGAASLFELMLYHNRIALAGAKALAASPHLGNLAGEGLKVDDNIAAAGLAALRERFADRVWWAD